MFQGCTNPGGQVIRAKKKFVRWRPMCEFPFLEIHVIFLVPVISRLPQIKKKISALPQNFSILKGIQEVNKIYFSPAQIVMGLY